MQVVRFWSCASNASFQSIEAWRAMQLEWFLSKEELLETYLNHVPYGRNVED